MTYYDLNIKRGDRVEITQDIMSFDGNKTLIKAGSQGIFQGGSCELGLILVDGKKRNIKVYYDYMVRA